MKNDETLIKYGGFVEISDISDLKKIETISAIGELAEKYAILLEKCSERRKHTNEERKEPCVLSHYFEPV